MLAFERNSGTAAPQLQAVGLPVGCQLLWDAFIEMHNRRGGGMGPQPISWRDLQAWQDVRQVSLTAWEIDTLLALDSAAMQSHNEAAK